MCMEVLCCSMVVSGAACTPPPLCRIGQQSCAGVLAARTCCARLTHTHHMTGG